MPCHHFSLSLFLPLIFFFIFFHFAALFYDHNYFRASHFFSLFLFLLFPRRALFLSLWYVQVELFAIHQSRHRPQRQQQRQKWSHVWPKINGEARGPTIVVLLLLVIGDGSMRYAYAAFHCRSFEIWACMSTMPKPNYKRTMEQKITITLAIHVDER